MTEFLSRARRVAAILAISCCAALLAHSAQALAPQLVHDLALGENEEKIKAIATLVASGDPGALPVLQSLLNGEVQKDGQFNVVWKTKGPIRAQPWSQYIEGNDKKKDEPEKK